MSGTSTTFCAAPASPSGSTTASGAGHGHLEDAIEEALHQAQAISFCSPNAGASQWVKREITYAMAQEKAVFPLLIAGDQRTAVPPASSPQWVDGRTMSPVGQGRLRPAATPPAPGRSGCRTAPPRTICAPAGATSRPAAPPVAFDWVEIPAGNS
ncbi:MAG: toll/interleukin-1 receptor domain-containing protein [Caldilinea sp.]|nr:toll/interleukin-1 receptor domain-containing protein [Caldilinea sp.]